jgi:signal peptidase II
MKFLAAVALPLYALDQLTKWAAIAADERGLLPYEAIEDFFTLVYWQNTGAAFSIGTGKNHWFIALSLIALAALLVAWAKNVFPDRLSQWGAALMLSGILGNLTDRIVHGFVVDFLLFDLHVPFANPWPAFNVADSCICVAVFFFFLASFIPMGKKPRAEAGC